MWVWRGFFPIQNKWIFVFLVFSHKNYFLRWAFLSPGRSFSADDELELLKLFMFFKTLHPFNGDPSQGAVFARHAASKSSHSFFWLPFLTLLIFFAHYAYINI